MDASQISRSRLAFEKSEYGQLVLARRAELIMDMIDTLLTPAQNGDDLIRQEFLKGKIEGLKFSIEDILQQEAEDKQKENGGTNG